VCNWGVRVPGGEDGIHVGDGSARSQDTVSALKFFVINITWGKRLLTRKEKIVSVISIY
jgi:hypothetical protein